MQLQKTPQIKMFVVGETFEGNAHFLTDRAEHERAMAAFGENTGYFDLSLSLGASSEQWA